MSSEADIILTPLMGGKEEGGVCSLLEVGGFRILLDCGSTIATKNERLLEIASTLRVGGGIDCVIISHADTHHMGGLPVIFGDQGLSPVPVVCSLPVAKFGTMLLYDMQLNVEMEGRPVDDEEEGAENQKKSGEGGRISYPRFTLDDIDNCLSRVVPLKYSQTIDLNTLLYSGRTGTNMEEEEDEDELKRRMEASKISLCACNSGRTIGGSAWNIRYGSTDVVYLMDFNLKKEVVVDVAALESLPHSPSLLIVNGDCTSHKDVKVAATAGRKRKEASSSTSASSETASLTGLVMETLRNRGSVLIPCETSARSLELFQLLGRFWAEQKLGLDHLVFLSPMAHNILEYVFCCTFFSFSSPSQSIAVCLSVCLSVCLHSLTPHGKSLTIIFPSINHQLTQYSLYYYNTGTHARSWSG
jgi:cleavage and polyadenylation specificity factor subunit 2